MLELDFTSAINTIQICIAHTGIKRLIASNFKVTRLFQKKWHQERSSSIYETR